MRVKILTSSALVDQAKGKWAGLAEEVTVSEERGEYLISVGAAKKLDNAGPAAGTSTTGENPATREQPQSQPKAAPVRRAPKTK